MKCGHICDFCGNYNIFDLGKWEFGWIALLFTLNLRNYSKIRIFWQISSSLLNSLWKSLLPKPFFLLGLIKTAKTAIISQISTKRSQNLMNHESFQINCWIFCYNIWNLVLLHCLVVKDENLTLILLKITSLVHPNSNSLVDSHEICVCCWEFLEKRLNFQNKFIIIENICSFRENNAKII